ncbi:MAG: hypothetical protein L6Q71_05785, partial [Planctomycetes bacterium]|nr:hypothetical protein [Planctomycetota bacterium]
SPNDRVRSSSVALVTSVCQGLSRSGVATVVLDGGVVDAPGAIWPAIEASLEEGGDDTAKLVKQALELRAALIDKALPALCRSIFELTKACEGLRFGILTPLSPLGVCLPTEMEHLLSDAPPKAVGYWHSTSAARCLENLGVANEEQWLDRFGPRMFGVYLSDSVGAQGEQAPGLGEVNFKRIKPYLATNMARVLTIDDDASSSKLRFGADHLCEVGIF